MARQVRADPLGGPAQREVLSQLLAGPRYEVLPLAGVVDDAVAHLPAGATVTVTASPARGPEPTVQTAEALAAEGFHAVPHLAATQHGERSLPVTLERLQTAGIQEVFAVGGDAAPGDDRRGAGTGQRGETFDDGEQLLQAVRRLAPELRVGVPGYPEGHLTIPAEALEGSLGRKVDQASCVVGQLCFDPQTVLSWAAGLQAAGMRLPVFAGLPGAASSAQLMRIAGRIGVGESLRFLASGGAGVARRLASLGRYDPTPLAAGLAAAQDGGVVSGLHLYTFNALEETELWRRRLLARLQEGDHA